LSTQKEELLATLEEKKSLLSHSTKHASSWNIIKYKSPGNIQTSKSYVKLLQKDIKQLEIELAAIDK
jgi:hypothetical protein